ncbi:MAG: hypothetical protein UU24_C0025G0004 [Candidatus Nomurabacteria bacterium GW2011_GWA2_40_9]|uniref:Right handed beta helix domain-containing protein n=1 Tax=Candidatus Nomurabacteria bacterium GW2011_GWA2_40_9 TaxID=1618734 RepID=A0A0G0W3L4_9BACT|nr:MAG: hypothetical protein UU24_C0025G0004 [Candidatus Nomurabacteria bacterium GW2011_GWA2_40_9]
MKKTLKAINWIGKFIKKRKKLVLLLVFLAVLFSLYSSNRIVIDLPQELYEYVHTKIYVEKWEMDDFPIIARKFDFISRIADDVNIFKIKKNLLDGNLPVIKIKLSANDIIHFKKVSEAFQSAGYSITEINTWREVKLDYQGNEYTAKIKFHGDMPGHWSNNLKSYRIEIENGSINNIRRFNLIIFEDRLLDGKTTRILAKDFGLFDIRDDIVVLNINGVLQGVYYLQELLDQDFCENNKISSCAVIKTTDNFAEDHPYGSKDRDPNGVFLAGGHITAFDYELGNIELGKSDLDLGKVLYANENLLRAVKNKDPNIADYFDIEQISSFEAFRTLIGKSHLVAGDNLRMLYSATNGKFYPIPSNEDFGKLKLERGGFERDLNMRNTYFIELFYLLNKNDQIRQLKYKKLYNYALNNSLLEEFSALKKKYLPYALSYKTNNYPRRYVKYTIESIGNALKYNLELVKRNLEYSKAYINAIEKGNMLSLEIIPDSTAQINFDYLKINLSQGYSGGVEVILRKENGENATRYLYIANKTSIADLTEAVNGLYFSAGLDEDLYPMKRAYPIEVIFSDAERIDINHIELQMRNDITNQVIAENDIYLQLADGNDYYDYYNLDVSFENFAKRYSEFSWEYKEDMLTLKKGKYILKHDLIIPKSFSLEIQEGTEILIDDDKSIVAYNSVNIAGTRENPVKIMALDNNKPFGVFGIIGNEDDNENSKSYISWLELSGGNEKFINGLYLSGALSIYYEDVVMSNTRIHDNNADDGLNIKYSDIVIDSSEFYNNFADQFDCDFCNGAIKDSRFDGNDRKNQGGDGLDLSGSKVLIKNNQFLGAGDKGISIGEDTGAVLYKNKIENSNDGIAVKDLSKAFVIEDSFKGNGIAISLYQKKQLFGEAYAYLYNVIYEGNEKIYNLDDNSKIYKLKLSEQKYSQITELIKEENVDELIAVLSANTEAGG